MRILITGGHHNSALVIANALKQQGHAITWVGHRRTMIADPHDSLEYQDVTAAGLPFINTWAGKFHAAHPLHYLRLPLGLIQAVYLLLVIRPQLLLTFGGYIAVPIALVGRVFNIPILAFEQTATIGRANEIIRHFARMNFLAWASSAPHFPNKRTQVIGLPLHPQLLTPVSHRYFSGSKPTLLITGGKQGAHILNQAVFQLLPQLVSRYNIIHQTGASISTGDWNQAQQLHYPSYLPRPHFSAAEMPQVLNQADCVISRAGAHIVYELLVLRKPAILTPLPFSYRDEQTVNAKLLVRAGLGVILPQSELNRDNLLSALDQARSLKKTHPPTLPINATETVLAYIHGYFKNI